MILKKIIGILMIVAGIAGLVLPVIPGTLLIVSGILVLSGANTKGISK